MKKALLGGLLMLGIGSAYAQSPVKLYGFADVPVVLPDGQVLRDTDGTRIMTRICFVTVSGQQDAVDEVDVAGYPSKIVHYGVYVRVPERYAEIVDAVFKTQDNTGTYHVTGLSVPMRLSEYPQPGCNDQQWWNAGSVAIHYRPGTVVRKYSTLPHIEITPGNGQEEAEKRCARQINPRGGGTMHPDTQSPTGCR